MPYVLANALLVELQDICRVLRGDDRRSGQHRLPTTDFKATTRVLPQRIHCPIALKQRLLIEREDDIPINGLLGQLGIHIKRRNLGRSLRLINLGQDRQRIRRTKTNDDIDIFGRLQLVGDSRCTSIN